MDVGLGIERRHYLEREDCGDETYGCCEDMHHVHLLLGLKEGVCCCTGSVLADVSPCSGLALGQKGLGVTEEDETVDGVESEVRRKQWIGEQWAPRSKCDARWPIPLCWAVQQRYRNVWKWEVDYIESLVNQDSAQDHALYGSPDTVLESETDGVFTLTYNETSHMSRPLFQAYCFAGSDDGMQSRNWRVRK